MHPFRQLAKIFQEESHAASAPVGVALASIAGRLEALARECEMPRPEPQAEESRHASKKEKSK